MQNFFVFRLEKFYTFDPILKHFPIDSTKNLPFYPSKNKVFYSKSLHFLFPTLFKFIVIIFIVCLLDII